MEVPASGEMRGRISVVPIGPAQGSLSETGSFSKLFRARNARVVIAMPLRGEGAAIHYTATPGVAKTA
jgi:hypothetical protein